MKNILLLLNNRSLHFYDFKELKESSDIRLSVIVFNKSSHSLPEDAQKFLDNIYVIPDRPTSYGSLEFFPRDTLDEIVKKEINDFPDTQIVAADELNNLMVSSIREKYSLQGTTYSTTLKFRNKGLQKEALAESGLRFPKFKMLERSSLEKEAPSVFEELHKRLGIPFIVKPLDMSATIGVEKIDSYDQFCTYISKYTNFSNFIAEEFIEGDFYHCDFIIRNNEYVFIEASKYFYNGLAFINGYNHGSILLKPDNPLRLPIIDFCKAANSYLGLQSGSAHFEVFVTKEKEIIFLEAAARPPGSVVPLILTKTFRNNFMNAALLAEIEEHPAHFKEPEEYYFWACFPKKTGHIKELKMPVLKSPYQAEWYVKAGDVIEKPSSSLIERVGMFLVHNKDYTILESDYNYMRHFETLRFV
ncbi:MAG: ATP-grasp domain-containing protein [Alphaproteobacteria bacterium]|nr:ATP-grasp domain-containing protein [Alphaproteobacteria bacterium]